MQNIQLATISPSNRAEGKFTVCAHSDDGQQSADFDCESEHDAIVLRGAIRTHAARLRHVTDFRDKPGRAGSAEIARLQAQVVELQALSVTNIMTAVVPGDGSGQEVYAKSVNEVVDLLTKLSEQAEESDSRQAQVDALADALRKVSVIGNEDGLSRDEYQQRLIASAGYASAALAAAGR